MKSSAVRLTSQTRTQTEIEIRRRRNGAETADHLSQLRLLLVKLPASGTLPQVFHCSRAARLTKHQLIEFSTNHFATVFSHNTFTLQICVHLLAQEPTRAADPRLHRAFARLQDLCDLVITAPVHVAENQRRAILLRQRADRALHRVASLRVDQFRVLQRAAVRWIQLLRLASIGWLKEPGQRNKLASLSFSEL